MADLLAWWTHWLHHRVPTLWCFHAVHHSQTRLNVLSDNRQHVVETMVAAGLAFVPARVLGLDGPAAATLAFLTVYVSAFIHANLRTNLGPLGFVFISPQAHRVHHSVAPEHHDTNFGTVFALWDHLFGTAHPDRTSFPTTGIADAEFPLEVRANPVALVHTWLRQNLHPFRLLARRSVDRRRDARHSRRWPSAHRADGQAHRAA